MAKAKPALTKREITALLNYVQNTLAPPHAQVPWTTKDILVHEDALAKLIQLRDG